MKLVEYGKLNNNHEPTSSRETIAKSGAFEKSAQTELDRLESKILLSQKTEKLLFSGLIMSASIISLLAGVPTDSMIYAALIPAIWYDNYGAVNKDDSSDDSSDESSDETSDNETNDEQSIIKNEPSIDKADHETSTDTSTEDASENLLDIDEIMEKNLVIKMKTIRLSQQLCKLSGPLNMTDYKKDSTYDDMIYYFSKMIPKTSYLKTAQAIQEIDPRIYLKIVNKECDLENEPTPDQIIIPVRVRDSAWIGWPSANTQIIDIDDIAHFYCLD